MFKLSIDLPDSLLISMGGSLERVTEESNLLLASQLFAKGYITSGQAAKICHLGRVEFLLSVSKMGIPVADIERDEIDNEFADLKKL